VLVVGAVVFVDTMFYAAIAPLLPSLAHSLHLTKLSAGVMTAGYPAGTLVGSLPGGIFAVRVGPKRTVYAGLVLLGVSTLAFGFLEQVAWLDVARFVEGLGGACSWAGGLAWIVAEAPAQRRGGLIGAALGAAIAGALFGPVIGTIAGAVGRGAAFSGVVALSVALMDQARRLPLAHEASGQGLGHLVRVVRARRAIWAIWLVALPAAISGVLNVLGPLRLHRFGLGAVAIGATFLASASLEAAVSPVVGWLSDRHGRIVPLRIGLTGVVALLACFTLPSSGLVLAVVIVATAVGLGWFWAPAMALLADVAAAGGLQQGLAAAVMNLAWATGQIAGSGAGGAAAKAAGDAIPTAAAAILCAVSLLLLGGLRAPGRPAPRWSRRRSPLRGWRSGAG
jgi:MFS family permease